MRLIKTASATLLAVLAMTALTTGTASATKLTLGEGGVALATGTTFEAYGEENLFLDTSIGAFECVGVPAGPTFGMKLEVATNAKAGDELKVLGSGGNAGSGQCRGGPLGHAAVQAISLGPLKLNSKGKATEGPVVFHIEWERGRGPEGFAECYFAARKLKGTNNATPSSAPLQLELGGTLKLDKSFANSEECPKQAQVSFALASTVNDEEEEDRIEEQT
jgi:hypothetical protein